MARIRIYRNPTDQWILLKKQQRVLLKELSKLLEKGMLRGYIRNIITIKKDKTASKAVSFGYRDGRTVRHLYVGSACARKHVQPLIKNYDRAKSILKEIASLELLWLRAHKKSDDPCGKLYLKKRGNTIEFWKSHV